MHNAAVPGLKRSLHCPTFVPEVDQLDGGGSPKASAGQSLRCALGSSRFAAPHFPHVPERGFSSAGRPEQSRARALSARSSKTLDGEDDRTRWLARKMGQGVGGVFPFLRCVQNGGSSFAARFFGWCFVTRRLGIFREKKTLLVFGASALVPANVDWKLF